MEKITFEKVINELTEKLKEYEEGGKFGQLEKRIGAIKDMSKRFYGKLNNQIMKQDQIIMNSEFFVNEVA